MVRWSASGRKIAATASAITAIGKALEKSTIETLPRDATLSTLWVFGMTSSAFAISPYQRPKRIAKIAINRLDADRRSLIVIMRSAEH